MERRWLLADEYGIVRGFVYEDVNNNGQIDAQVDPTISGLVFVDRNNNGTQEWDQGEFDNEGDNGYAFKLPVGKVAVRHVLSEGWDVVAPQGGGTEVTVTPGSVSQVDFLVRRRLDWGDAPDTPYPTLAASNGARHWAIQGYSLGARIDAEANGQPNATATGDDVSTGDEDGVTGMSPLVSGGTAIMQVEFRSDTGQTGVLDAWMDFNANGSWGDAGERIATGFVLAPGPNTLSVAVPATATPGTTYARFRLSPNGVSAFTGTGIVGAAAVPPLHGEVEDYQLRIEPGRDLDWGDAPDTAGAAGPAPYPTLSVHNGARHEVLSNFTLGTLIDAESDGQPTANADGDDAAASDDEDGVAFLDPLVPGAAARIQLTLNPLSPSNGVLDAWIDWNANGNWGDAGEQIATNFVLVPGSGPANLLNITVPTSAKIGPSYARFRLAQQPGSVTSFTGFGGRGEVEDYNPRIIPDQNQSGPLDWGDAPVTFIPSTVPAVGGYPTFATQNGARHRIVTGFRLGAALDAEVDGQPTANSDGDDVNGAVNDEDGVTFLDSFIPGANARIQVNFFSASGAQGRLDAWIDWNADDSWAQPGDRIATAFVLNPGPNILNVAAPATAATGQTYSRFRLSRQGVSTFTGFGGDGEVEDYDLAIRNRTNRRLDWGDAPDSPNSPAPLPYPTLAVHNGARHVLRPGFNLGPSVDAEANGQPNASATGDDLSANDENGVIFPATGFVPGATTTIQVNAPLGGVLDAWIDWFGNGNWADPPDRIATTFVLSPGPNSLTVNVPTSAKLGQTYARFRLSPNGVASYDGFGYEGEVEDYVLRVQPHGELDWGDARKNYPVLSADNGARHIIRPGFTLGPLIDAEPDGQPSPGADRDDITPVGLDDEDGVTLAGGVLIAGSNATFTVNAPGGGVLDAWIDLNIDGDWADAGEHVIVASGLAAGNNVRIVPNLAATAIGQTYARFRLTRQGIATFAGPGGEGEVEDYTFPVRTPTPNDGPFDWGDAPDAPYPTLLASNGARHSLRPGFILGKLWDSEPNGQPSALANRDDLTNLFDEDGVQFLDPLERGKPAQILVRAPSGGILDAWMDWDGNGNWTGASDRIFTAFPLVAGDNLLTLNVPAGPAGAIRAFSRFRLSEQGVASFTAFGGNGEVEDYAHVINGPTVKLHRRTGTVYVQGTAGDDKVMVSRDPRNDLLMIDDLSTPGEADWMLPSFDTELLALSLHLGDGNDEMMAMIVDATDYVVWRKTDGAGGSGNDKLTVDFAAEQNGHNFFINSEVIMGRPTQSIDDPFFFDLGAELAYGGFEHVSVMGTMGNDLFNVGNGGGSALKPRLSVAGGPGNDGFRVDSFFDVFADLSIDGGPHVMSGPGDELSVFGDGSVRNIQYAPMVNKPDAGILVVDGMPISFTGLEPVNIASFASFELELPVGASGNDLITIDDLVLDTGDSNTISGTSNGTGFEHATITDIGALTLDTAFNDLATLAASTDVVNFNGSIIGAAAFTMPPGRGDLTLNVNAGVIPIGWDPGALGAPVTVNVAGGAQVQFNVTQHLRSLALAASARAVLSTPGPDDTVLVTRSLSIAPTGVLDLTNGAAVIDYTGPSPLGAIAALLASGYANGAWTGNGINSSIAAITPGTALGFAESADVARASGRAFAGQEVDDTAVLIHYTLVGDTDLDRDVDLNDLGNLASNFGAASGKFWYHGNLDFDGDVDLNDLGSLATYFDTALPTRKSNRFAVRQQLR